MAETITTIVLLCTSLVLLADAVGPSPTITTTMPTTKEKDFAVCVYLRRTADIHCRLSKESTWSRGCEVTTPRSKLLPLKPKLYILGEAESVFGLSNFHKLYPKVLKNQDNRDGTQFYDYDSVNPDTGRSHLAFHTGPGSRCCLAVRQDCYTHNLTAVLDRTKRMELHFEHYISQNNTRYKHTRYGSGFLEVWD